MTAVDTVALAMIGAPVLGMLICGLVFEADASPEDAAQVRYERNVHLIRTRRIQRAAEQQLDAIVMAALQQMVVAADHRRTRSPNVRPHQP